MSFLKDLFSRGSGGPSLNILKKNYEETIKLNKSISEIYMKIHKGYAEAVDVYITALISVKDQMANSTNLNDQVYLATMIEELVKNKTFLEERESVCQTDSLRCLEKAKVSEKFLASLNQTSSSIPRLGDFLEPPPGQNDPEEEPN